MIDVFLAHDPGSSVLRHRMYRLVLERWNEQLDCNVIVQQGSGREFQRSRRIEADILSKSDVYVVADDDCLLPPAFYAQRMLSALASHPTFAILTPWPQNFALTRWTPEDYTPWFDDDVEEHVSVGAIRFCRKGSLKEWPAVNGPGYDQTHCRALREAGWRSGYFRHYTFNHLGQGYSTT